MDVINKLEEISLFDTLDSRELNYIQERAILRSYGAGKVIFTEGEEGKSLYILLKGRVKISKVSPEGKEKILAIIKPGGYFGEMALVDGRARSAMAQTLEPSQLLAIGQNELRDIFARHPGIAIKMLGELSLRLRETNRQLKEAVFHNTRERLWHELKHLARSNGKTIEGGTLLDIQLTHRELGEMIGASRETVTRLLGRLQDEGLIKIKGKKIIIKD